MTLKLPNRALGISSLFDWAKEVHRAISDITVSVDTVTTEIVTVGGAAVTDHGGLDGLSDAEDHPDYLLLDGSRDSTGAQAFTAGVVIGGVTGSDILISSDAASASDVALTTAGYVGAQITANAFDVDTLIITTDGGLVYDTDGVITLKSAA